MNYSNNITDIINRREWHLEYGGPAVRALQVTDALVRRLGLQTELDGHTGCVNCLEWNSRGSLLASGSDDAQVILWEPHRHKMVSVVPTPHTGNIFSVKFLPESEDRLVATCAADCQIKVLDVAFREVTHHCGCHTGRVKRLAVAPHIPYLVWSAGEDGLVMQLDLRVKHQCRPAGGGGSVLINLQQLVGIGAEAKCLSINPTRPHLLAVGANDSFVRVYDRRMVRLSAAPGARTSPPAMRQEAAPVADAAVQYFAPGHLSHPKTSGKARRRARSLAVTYVTYSSDGTELLANLGGEQVYLFDAVHPRTADMFDTSPLSRPDEGAAGPDGEPQPATLPPRLDALRLEANRCHQEERYSQAIDLNSRALLHRRRTPTLYSNRAAAYMKRAWNGDVYAALRDCQSTLALQPGHVKAAFRLCWCLLELGQLAAAGDALAAFRRRHSQQANSYAVRMLERDLKEAQFHSSPEGSPGTAPRLKFEPALEPTPDSLSEQERVWRHTAADYHSRYCGHCNTTTDIKEANFFGGNGQFIVAGSDDGTFFIWDRQTASIVRVLRGDTTIVNCLQPHPQLCLLASSGIDSCVRLWTPLPDGAHESRRVADTERAAQDNQQRMNADPVDMMLLNFSGRQGDGEDVATSCRTS